LSTGCSVAEHVAHELGHRRPPVAAKAAGTVAGDAPAVVQGRIPGEARDQGPVQRHERAGVEDHDRLARAPQLMGHLDVTEGRDAPSTPPFVVAGRPLS
jgi:hypothetical protein